MEPNQDKEPYATIPGVSKVCMTLKIHLELEDQLIATAFNDRLS